MKFVDKLDMFLFLSGTWVIAFIRMEAHKPILFPSCSCLKVLLELSRIINRVYLFIDDTVICK